jgi:hypothetical protein
MHTVTVIFYQIYGLRAGNVIEAGPACATFEFSVGIKDHISTDGAVIVTGFVIMQKLACKRRFCPLLAKYVVLLGCQSLL